MEDQQERLKIRKLSWLGGIIDGEGTITIRIHNRKHNRTLLTSVFSVANTNKIIIDKIEEILKEFKIPFWMSYTDKTKRWKPKWEIHVMGLRRVKKFLPIINEFLVGKKKEGELALQWCNRRLSKLGKNEFYDDDELRIYNEIKSLHGHQDQVHKIFRILND